MKGLHRSLSRGTAQANIVRQSVAIAATISVAGTTGVGYGSAVIGDFPQGNILFLGAVAYAKFVTADVDVQAAFDGDYSIGSAATADATLSGSEVDIIASTPLGAATAQASPVVRGVSAAAICGTVLDNTDGSLELNLNLLIDDANISGAADFTASGVVELSYVILGDD